MSSKFFRVFQNYNCLILSKESLGQTLAKLIRILIRSSSWNILLYKREIFFLLQSKQLLFKRQWVSWFVRIFGHKGRVSLCGSEIVKGIYTLEKSQVGYLRIGRRHRAWPNQYKNWVCISLFPKLLQFIAFYFYFSYF